MPYKKKKLKQAGLSLIEVSLCLTILTALIAGGVWYYQMAEESRRLRDTVKQLSMMIVEAIPYLSRLNNIDSDHGLANYIQAKGFPTRIESSNNEIQFILPNLSFSDETYAVIHTLNQSVGYEIELKQDNNRKVNYGYYHYGISLYNVDRNFCQKLIATYFPPSCAIIVESDSHNGFVHLPSGVYVKYDKISHVPQNLTGRISFGADNATISDICENIQPNAGIMLRCSSL